MTKTSACMLCKHFNSDQTCAAFPKGIPDEFLFGDKFHFVSTGNDQGIIFEPENKRAEDAAKTLGFNSEKIQIA